MRSHEAYIWTLFDGGTTLEDALDLSPLDELETLRVMKKLEELGLVRVERRMAG